ncbi:MAG: hypothetical protein ACLFU3_04715 [Dichotomicrobium sp.]
MQQIVSALGVIAVWIGLSVGAWWLHRLHLHRKQRRRMALANEAWMRIREAPEIFADIRAAGAARGASGRQARTHALLSRVRDYGDYFDDVSALRAELSRALKRDDCPPLTEILNMRRDIWAAADVLLIDDPAVFGEAFAEPGEYEEFCRDAEDLLFLDAAPLTDDPVSLRLALAEEDMQTFVSGVESEIADERERERFPTWREIVAYPVSWARAVPRILAWLGRAAVRLGRGVITVVARGAQFGAAAIGATWRVLAGIPGAIAGVARRVAGMAALVPRLGLRLARISRFLALIWAGLTAGAGRLSGYATAAAHGLAGLRHHAAVERVAASMRRASDRFPEQVSQGLTRAAEMTRDVRARAAAATGRARERALGFETSELGMHYDFLVKAHGLRQRYADMLRRAPELTDTGRQFVARLELEKRSERLRLGTAKLRRRARLELVRFLSVLIAALERLRDRLADAPPQPAQTTNLLTAPLHRMFLPPPSPREAGADFPGGLRAQARSWARGWGRSGRRMRDVSPEDDADEPEAPPKQPEAAETQAREPDDDAQQRQSDRSDAPEPETDDPTEDAIRRVRQLFGIRDRHRQARGRTRHKQQNARRNGADKTAANGEAAASGSAGTSQDPGTRRSGKAQILPPLRGSRAGIYDEGDGPPRSRDTLRSRLSALGAGGDGLGTGESDGESEPGDDREPARDSARSGGRWRRWFGS